MQERNFEKQVQQKMEELSFTPSEPVWKKVEEQIRKKKDRRKIIFWMLPLLLVTGGAYFWFNEKSNVEISVAKIDNSPSTEQTIDKTETRNNQQETTRSNKETTTARSSVPATDLKQEQKDSHSSSEVIVIATSKNPTDAIKAQTKIASNTKTTGIKRASVPIDNFSEEISSPKIDDKIASDNNEAESKRATINEKETEPATQQSNTTVVASPDLEQTKDLKDSVAAEPTKQDIKDTVASRDSVVQTPKTAKPIVKKKWQWSGHATAGVSKLSSGSAKATQAFMPASDLLAFNGNNLQAAAPAPPPIQDQFLLIHENFAFEVGTDLKRNISPRFSVSGGLQYNYFSTWNYVGKSVNNTTSNNARLNSQVKANRFYLANSAEKEKYTNRYHYITVPIAFQWQVLKKLPLQLSAGVNVSRLVATNAMYFDGQRQIYYEDDSYFNKNRFALAGAVSYRILKIKGAEFYAGPQANLGLTSLYKENTTGKRLLFAGLRSEVRF